MERRRETQRGARGKCAPLGCRPPPMLRLLAPASVAGLGRMRRPLLPPSRNVLALGVMTPVYCTGAVPNPAEAFRVAPSERFSAPPGPAGLKSRFSEIGVCTLPSEANARTPVEPELILGKAKLIDVKPFDAGSAV